MLFFSHVPNTCVKSPHHVGKAGGTSGGVWAAQCPVYIMMWEVVAKETILPG